MTREYAAIECYLFKDEEFLTLNQETKLVWLWMLGNQSRVNCPGLIAGNVFSLAQYLFWPLKVSDDARLAEALKISRAAIEAIVSLGWAEHDLKAGLFFLPNAVSKNLPIHRNMLWSWVQKLETFPSSPLIRRWSKTTQDTCVQAFGREDDRTVLMVSLCKSLAARSPLEVSGYQVKTTRKGKDDELKGFYDGYPHGVEDGLPSVIKGLKVVKKKEESKPEEPKKTWTQRQVELWRLFRTEKFYVPGKGEQTVWENVADPISLCEKLGGKGFTDVGLDLVYRLSAWSFDKKDKARRNLGQQLRACFAREQSERKPQLSLPTSVRPLEVVPDRTPDQERARLEALKKAGMDA